MSKRICIIGGSGFVGRAITRAAVRKGFEVTVTCRHPERARDLLVSGVKLARADVVDGRGLDDAIAGADCVINLVGILFEKGRYTFEAVHVHGTEHVLEACKRAGVGQYLHMSALGAGTVKASSYARTKADAEMKVKSSGLNRTIFRPSIIYGAGDAFFNRFARLSRLGPVMPVIHGETRFQPVWVEDVARAYVAAVGNRHVRDRTYELAGPRTYSFEELLRMLLDRLGRRRLLVPVPNAAARMLAAVAQHLPTPLITPDQLILLEHDNVATDEPFPAIFGEPHALEEILPTFITGSRQSRLQRRFDRYRRRAGR